MAFHYKLSSFFLFVSLFVSVQLLSWIEATNRKGGITIDFIRRDSHHLPSYSPLISRFDRLKSSFERSISRKSSLHRLSTLRKTSIKPQEDIQAPVTANGGEYLMKVSIGTPPFEILAIADTGSDLTWTQCKPCTECYKQKAPLFDPKKSGTYRTTSCRSPSCALLSSSASCGTSNVCDYQYSYGDSSYSIGELSTETLTFGSAGSSFPSVVFGCGHQNAGTFSDEGSGLVGLGNGPLSIVNQLGKTIGGKFSYCLTLIGSNATSTLSLGDQSSVVGPNVVSTPLLKKTPDTFYFLTLESVSVGNKRFYGSSSKAASVEEGNIIIDSGTTLTFLPSALYEELETALLQSVQGTPASTSQGSTFKLCYEKSNNFRAPLVTAHFKGADVVLTRESTFLEVEQGVLCLTLVPSDDLAIFGNLHQMNYQVGYDIVGGKVDFLAKDCSKSG